MKIKAEITAVRTTGDTLVVHAQGGEVSAGEWDEMKEFVFQVRDIAAARKSLYVGRSLVITIEAR